MTSIYNFNIIRNLFPFFAFFNVKSLCMSDFSGNLVCWQHSTAQHSTAQHSTAQHSTAQHHRITPPALIYLIHRCIKRHKGKKNILFNKISSCFFTKKAVFFACVNLNRDFKTKTLYYKSRFRTCLNLLGLGMYEGGFFRYTGVCTQLSFLIFIFCVQIPLFVSLSFMKQYLV